MDFSAFDTNKIDEYAEEAKKKWGNTKEYKGFEEKTENQNKQQQNEIAENLMEIFARFGQIKDGSSASPDAVSLVKELQNFISSNYYPCTDEILVSLGKMYSDDERFRRNIDTQAGEGTAKFVSDAIEKFINK